MDNLSEDRIINDRLQKLEKIRSLKIDPYPSKWDSDRKIIGEIIGHKKESMIEVGLFNYPINEKNEFIQVSCYFHSYLPI